MKKNIFSCAKIVHVTTVAYRILILLSMLCASDSNTENRAYQSYQAPTPRLTVIFVVDQLSYRYIQNLKPYFTGGFKTLIEQGVNYTNAYWPHATPCTATGHAGLSTGTFARYHGIVGNSWYTNNQKMYADNEPEKSAKNMKVDGLSDQFMLAAKPQERRHVYALSSKSRAAIMMASKMGKALWFDTKTGWITSSKAYFEQLPSWVQDFNTKKNLASLPTLTWKRVYPEKSPAYELVGLADYIKASEKTLIDQTITIDHTAPIPYEPIYHHPYINSLILDLAQDCIKTTMAETEDHLLLWISLSALDPVAHIFGPDSREALDMVYHLDKDLQTFFEFVLNKFDKTQTLFALTADHGVMPIPEKIHERGYPAHRINPKELLEKINKSIDEKFGLSSVILHYKNAQLFLDKKQLRALDIHKQNAILKTIKRILLQTPGIKSVWTTQDLDTVSGKEVDTFKYAYAQQRYKGRCGDLYIQPQPYTIITKWPTGTGHKSPYNYDTHVPLIMYQPGKLEKKVITKKVWPLQLAPTIADILRVPRPSAAAEKVLPQLWD
jgi:predicted AlkP superfamily pyrophosphatase or phosphodiesterase